MLPWGHLAIGYLLYSIGVHFRCGVRPKGPSVIALAVGTQAPDLIDKPLAWSFGILPSGRSLGHSLLFAVLLGIVVWIIGRGYMRRSEAIAFLVGHLSHVIVDVLPAVHAGQWDRLGSLLWPVTPAYQYPGEMGRSILEFLFALDLSALPVTGAVFGLLALGLWVYDGLPGMKTVFDSVQSWRLNHF